MFSKLESLTKFKKKGIPKIDVTALQQEFSEGLFKVMEEAFEKRKSDKKNSNFTESDIDRIVAAYAKKNMILAAAASIVPGPFGILGAMPELLLNFNNQMNMIYDLGCAYGKEDFINKDLLLEIPIAAFGGNTNLSSLQNNKIDLSDSPKQILVGKATELGKSVVERTLKKSIIQFIPVGGPLLMGTWAKITTAKISKGSKMFLDQTEHYVEHFKKDESDEVRKQLLIEKIKSLANLIESNNEINENQLDLIGTIIENAGLAKDEKKYYLEESLKAGSNFELNYQLIKDYEEADDLLMQLIVMAKRSGSIDEQEKRYIHEVGEGLGFGKPYVLELF